MRTLRDGVVEAARLLGDEGVPAALGFTCAEIADAHGKSAAQVVLRWHLQEGNVVIPKSATPERIRENIDLFDFELDGGEMEQIAALDQGERIGADPDTFDLR